jgi:hypothetical protein
MKKRCLVACECSGRVRDAFSARGWDAWSCDLAPPDTPGQHIRGDVLPVLGDGWDLLIAHPPCTRLTITANKWYKPEYADRFPNIHAERKAAIDFFMAFADAPVERICIENPVGIMSTLWRTPDQIIPAVSFRPSRAEENLSLAQEPAAAPTHQIRATRLLCF